MMIMSSICMATLLSTCLSLRISSQKLTMCQLLVYDLVKQVGEADDGTDPARARPGQSGFRDVGKRGEARVSTLRPLRLLRPPARALLSELGRPTVRETGCPKVS